MRADIMYFQIAGNELWRIIVVFCILLTSFVVGKIVGYILARGAKLDEQAGKEITLAKIVLRSASGPVVFMVFAGALNIAFLSQPGTYSFSLFA